MVQARASISAFPAGDKSSSDIMKCTCSKWGFFIFKQLPKLHKWDSFFSDPLPYFK